MATVLERYPPPYAFMAWLLIRQLYLDFLVLIYLFTVYSRTSSVGIATGYWLDDQSQ
jgi:hypothetical protein